MKYTIAVSGAAAGETIKKARKKAEELGKTIAEHGAVLITGATSGLPDYAARGAKKAGGTVIGFSPASTRSSHRKTYKLPVDYMDVIVYTGFEYAGRNLLLARSGDAVIVVGGRIGTLNEFTVAFEDNRLIGVLLGSGGISDEIQHIINIAKRGPGNILYDKDPKKLVERIIHELKRTQRNSK